jgi:two-component system, OmpR family, response regulator CpxR
MERILIVDDDLELCELVGRYLGAEGYEASFVHRGDHGVERTLNEEWDLVVLDVMLPGINGFDVLRRIRAVRSTPILMLTARGEDVDRIVGLELGADDYLAKPYNPRELLARIRAILRRANPSTLDLSGVVRYVVGDVELDSGARSVVCAGAAVNLTAVEFDLLRSMLAAAGRVLSREELSQSVLGRPYTPFDRVIDNHVSNLRRKLGPSPEGADRIKSIRNLGYLWTLPGKGVE